MNGVWLGAWLRGVAWLELWVVVPYWYIAAIRNCLQSGEMLAVSEWGVVRGVVKGRGLA